MTHFNILAKDGRNMQLYRKSDGFVYFITWNPTTRKYYGCKWFGNVPRHSNQFDNVLQLAKELFSYNSLH